MNITIGQRLVGEDDPTYFIADIGANHDGELKRAIHLIRLAASVGVDAVKFQHFRASRIVSRRGFDQLGQVAHQKAWPRSVFDTYEAASLPWEWTPVLKKECDDLGVHFLSTSYDLEAVDMLDDYVPAFKIGSGDITWIELIEHASRKGKPLIVSTGASNLEDVERVVHALVGMPFALLQCNTNYSGKRENLRHVNVRVISWWREVFPQAVLGLSDHTTSYTPCLAAVALGARIVEKHFTDDPTRSGPDHAFALDPHLWHDMIERTRELEMAMGERRKVIEANEQETAIIQRRILRAARDLPVGHVVTRADLTVLRPATLSGVASWQYTIEPHHLARVIGSTVTMAVAADEPVYWASIRAGGPFSHLVTYGPTAAPQRPTEPIPATPRPEPGG